MRAAGHNFSAHYSVSHEDVVEGARRARIRVAVVTFHLCVRLHVCKLLLNGYDAADAQRSLQTEEKTLKVVNQKRRL